MLWSSKPSTAPLRPVKIGKGSRGVTPPAAHVGAEDMTGGGAAAQSGVDEAPSGDDTGRARVAKPTGDVEAPGVDAQQAPSPRGSTLAAELGARSVRNKRLDLELRHQQWVWALGCGRSSMPRSPQ